MSAAIDSAREAVIKALTECGREYSVEAINRSASALGAFQKACEVEAVEVFAKNFCGEALAHLAAGLAGSLPTDEPLLTDHMRAARAILESALSYARESVRP